MSRMDFTAKVYGASTLHLLGDIFFIQAEDVEK